jgi:predicted small secreted protein
MKRNWILYLLCLLLVSAMLLTACGGGQPFGNREFS